MTPVLPLWYTVLGEFNYIFHTLIDVLFIVLGFAIIGVVSRPGWKHHLRWANPAAAATILTGIYRLVLDLHHYFKIGTPLGYYVASDLFNYAGNIVAAYSTYLLWRTLRDMALHPMSPDPLTEQGPPPGVWPPPPVVKR